MPPPASKRKPAEQMLLLPQKKEPVDNHAPETWELAMRTRYNPQTEAMYTVADDNITRLPVGNHRFDKGDGTFVRQPRLDKPPTQIDRE